MSKAEARVVADQILREANVTEPHIRVRKLAAGHGVEVAEERLDSGVSSILLRGKEPRILVNDRHSRAHKRLAAAHALGHFFLHSGGASAFVSDLMVHIRASDPARTDPRELEANAFALELLLPEHLLRRDLRDGRAVDLADENSVLELAERYRVTPTILTLRAVRLGLVWGL